MVRIPSRLQPLHADLADAGLLQAELPGRTAGQVNDPPVLGEAARILHADDDALALVGDAVGVGVVFL